MMYVYLLIKFTELATAVFSIFEILWSEFSKNTDRSVYLVGGTASMHYLQTVVQAVMPISQPGAFHCITKTVPPHAGDAIHPALQREWSGPVHETRSGVRSYRIGKVILNECMV